MKENQEKLKVYADTIPCDFSHRYTLVEAEIGKVIEQDMIQVLEKYATAVKQSEQSSFVNEEGLAKELAANYQVYLSEKFTREATADYSTWGAQPKSNKMVF